MNFKDFVSISEDVEALANINKDLSFDEFIDEVIVNSNFEKIRNQDDYIKELQQEMSDMENKEYDC